MIKAAWLEKSQVQLRDDVHGLDVFREQPEVSWLGIEATATVSWQIEGYHELIPDFFKNAVQFTPKQEFAVALYNLSHFEQKSETRFLILITAVEVLSSREKRSPQARNLLSKFATQIGETTLGPEEQRRLTNGLINLGRESIGFACRQYIENHSTREDADYFDKCYKARSELVHRGKTERLEPNNPTKLDDLVSRVLMRALTRRNLRIE